MSEIYNKVNEVLDLKTLRDNINQKANKTLSTPSADGLMSKNDKVKLDGIATNANNYVHPSTHPASVIAQDANNRFVSDAEKTKWNASSNNIDDTNISKSTTWSSDKSNTIIEGATIKYTAINGKINFDSDEVGYIDNIVLEGKTICNIFSHDPQSAIYRPDGQDKMYLFNDNRRSAYKAGKLFIKIFNIPNSIDHVWFEVKDKSTIATTKFITYSKSANEDGIEIDIADNEYIGTVYVLKGACTDDEFFNLTKDIVVTYDVKSCDEIIYPIAGFSSIGTNGFNNGLCLSDVSNNLIPSNMQWELNTHITSLEGEIRNRQNGIKLSKTPITIEPDETYVFTDINSQFAIFDKDMNLLPNFYYDIESCLTIDNYASIFSYHMPKNAKFIKINVGMGKDIQPCISKGDFIEYAQINTTLRSLDNLKDKIVSSNAGILKEQYVNEMTITNIFLGHGSNVTDLGDVIRLGTFLTHDIENRVAGNYKSNMFKVVEDYELNEEHFYMSYDPSENRTNLFVFIDKSKLNNIFTVDSIMEYLAVNGFKILYEMRVPRIKKLNGITNLNCKKGKLRLTLSGFENSLKNNILFEYKTGLNNLINTSRKGFNENDEELYRIKFKAIPRHTNLDNITESGFYTSADNSITSTLPNRPSDNAFTLEVGGINNGTTYSRWSYVYQKAIDHNFGKQFIRHFTAGKKWSAWSVVPTVPVSRENSVMYDHSLNPNFDMSNKFDCNWMASSSERNYDKVGLSVDWIHIMQYGYSSHFWIQVAYDINNNVMYHRTKYVSSEQWNPWIREGTVSIGRPVSGVVNGTMWIE